jgi:hypothetical protein
METRQAHHLALIDTQVCSQDGDERSAEFGSLTMAHCLMSGNVVLRPLQTPAADAAVAALAAVRESLAAVGQAAAPAAARFVAQASESRDALLLERAAVAAEARKLEVVQVRSPKQTQEALSVFLRRICAPCYS